MARFHRFREDNRPFFVTTSTLNRRPLFANAANADLLKTVIYDTRERYNFKLLSFVIMPDHFHAIIVPDPRNEIPDVMRYIKGRHARIANEAENGAGAVWQDSFHDHGIRDEESLWQIVRYIEDNPVAAGLTAGACDYSFSSAHPSCPTDLGAYLGQGESLTHDRL
jgi:REP element-mobilizing transposase RayT